MLLFSSDQAALWMVQSVRLCLSVCPSVCPSACHTFFTMFPSSYHHEIFRSYYHWQHWCPCKSSRSKVKVTEVKPQLSRFRIITPVWIHIWQWNDANSFIFFYQKRCPIVCQGHPSNFKVTRDKKSPILTRIACFRTVTPIWIRWWLWNDAQSLK